MSTRLAKRNKSPRAEKGIPPIIDDSPITVGGGGGGDEGGKGKAFRPIHIDVERPYDYPDKTGGSNKTKTFRNDDFVMKSIVVWIKGKKFDLSSLLTDAGSCKIRASSNKGSPHHIDIFFNDDGMGVKFHTGKYPPDNVFPTHESPDTANFIEKISVVTDVGSFKRQGLTADDEVVITVDIV